ncbi:MAG: hypothetical protein PW788_15260 [Micavibrio sp.]|nr:hypothetical protein [Micavibrio sp.]
MKTTIEIKDKGQLEMIEKLRGEKSAKEFVTACFEAGLKMAVAQRQQRAKMPMMKFESAKVEFRTLDAAAITAALKDKDAKNPVKLEVSRLVSSYTAELGAFAKKNGNRLPASLRVDARNAIEKIAFQITAEAIKHAVKNGKAAEKKSA